jgi:hypothetical protein
MSVKQTEREKRLAQALKENLLKRKEQMKSRIKDRKNNHDIEQNKS